MNPRKYENIAMLTTAIVGSMIQLSSEYNENYFLTSQIFLGTPHRFQSIQNAEDQLHDLLLLPGPEIRTELLNKIRNLTIQVKKINSSFLDTKLFNHATIFNIVVEGLRGSVRQRDESGDVSTFEESDPYNIFSPATPFTLSTHLVGHPFEASGRHIMNVTEAVGDDGEPLWAQLLADKLYRTGCSESCQ